MKKLLVEEPKMIKIILPIHIEEKNILLKEDLIEKIKLFGKHIECLLGKSKIYLIIVRSWKSSSPQTMNKEVNKVWILKF